MTRIETLKGQIDHSRVAHRDHQGYISGIELRTRAVLIDPILCALGWDVTDPSRVQIELKANGNEIDYVLVKEGRKHAVVEAKAANVAVDKHRKQASGYAVEIGVKYVIVTNGLRWEGWELKTGTPRSENMIVEVNVTTGDLTELARSLEKLSYDDLGS